jgi:hypothetical protein
MGPLLYTNFMFFVQRSIMDPGPTTTVTMGYLDQELTVQFPDAPHADCPLGSPFFFFFFFFFFLRARQLMPRMQLSLRLIVQP